MGIKRHFYMQKCANMILHICTDDDNSALGYAEPDKSSIAAFN